MKKLLACGFLVLAACEEPAAPAKTPMPVHEEEPRPQPAVPPKAVQASEAFYIVGIPKAVTSPTVAVCHSNAECNALLPPDLPNIVRRFNEESWVVIEVPAGQVAKNVISDGVTATARVEPTAGGESMVVLYRVAPGVAHAAPQYSVDRFSCSPRRTRSQGPDPTRRSRRGTRCSRAPRDRGRRCYARDRSR